MDISNSKQMHQFRCCDFADQKHKLTLNQALILSGADVVDVKVFAKYSRRKRME